MSAPAAAQSGAANAQSELRSAASRSGSGAAVEPRRAAHKSTDRGTQVHTGVLCAEHDEREQPLTIGWR